MARNLIGSGLVGVLLGALGLASSAHAADFGTLMAQAAAVNQTYVSQVESALTAPDLATSQARTRTALATGQQLINLLTAAEAAAPDDAGRSRAQGLLDHVRAAQSAGQSTLGATSLDAAHSALEAMRGEAVEALAELRPFAAPTPAPTPTIAQVPTTLPVTGGLGTLDLLAALGAGLALLAGGFGLRRLPPA